MRDTASSSPFSRLKRRTLAAVAAPTALVLGFGALPVAGAQSSLTDGITPGTPPQRSVIDTTYPDVEGLPAGVEVDRVVWKSPRHIEMWIKSAVMPEGSHADSDGLMQVEMLLARDWHANPERTFPEVWALDGLRAREDESGWTIETNIIQQYADKNVNVILPIGGQSSFYSDWDQPDNGVHYKWESFLHDELVPILDNEFRSNQKRAVVGLSMGGTAAMNLAQRNPQLFDFVGSFSGYLDTTSVGMPQAIAAAQLDAGRFDATKMWGPLGSQRWIDHDPKLGIEALEGKTVYVSSGSGQDPNPNPNAAGIGLEVLSRLTSQTFVDYAQEAGVPVTTKFRPSGIHSWDYWQFELNEAWPYIADALAIPEEDRGADCTVDGAIAEATQQSDIGSCVNDAYPVEGGEAQDFRSGTVYFSEGTGAHALFGLINTKYAELGGPASWLGFPITGERTTPDGVGRYVHFENGSIYWTPGTGAHVIPKDMFDHWETNGWETGDLGYPVGEAVTIDDGLVQEFQGGYLTRNPNGETHHIVHGAIADTYGDMDTARSPLGYPTSEEIQVTGGAFQAFENGNIYWSPQTGAHAIYYGAIFDAWGEEGWEQGPYGWPTSDMTDIPAGGQTIEFQNGTISQINGRIEEDLN